MSDLVPAGDEYARLLTDLRAISSSGRQRAVNAVNAEMVQTYWRIGERIVQEEQGGQARAEYGEQVLVRLGRLLRQEFGRGFDYTNLTNMRQFYLTYPNLDAVRQGLGWTHYRTLMRLPDVQREFYAGLAIQGRWSSRQLDKEIQSMLFERAALSRKPGDLAGTLPPPQAHAVPYAAAFKDPYILDFLDLADTYSEKDLETALVRNIEQFLLELGTDFAFMARQRRLSIDGDDYYVHLVFYHRTLRCLVLVDLKIGAFTPADAAQMQLYLEWTRRHDTRDGEGDPIGLILCGSRNEQVVELLLSSQTTQMHVAQYLLLNDMAAIKAHLAQMSAAYEQLQEPADPPADTRE